MKLEVGMYVRTLKGIAKIIGQNDDVRYYYPNAYVTDTYLNINDDTEYLYEDDILKASHNIIDLIEVGDYVNGVEVMEVDLEEKPYLKFVHGISTTDVGLITYMGDSKLYGIKSIVTKEQYESNVYKVGDIE